MFILNFPFIRFIPSYVNWLKKTNSKLTEKTPCIPYHVHVNVKIMNKNLLNVKATLKLSIEKKILFTVLKCGYIIHAEKIKKSYSYRIQPSYHTQMETVILKKCKVMGLYWLCPSALHNTKHLDAY